MNDPSVEPNAANYNIPSAAYHGFNSVYFYTTVNTWKQLSEGMLFYRFQSILPDSTKYEAGSWANIYGFASWSAGEPHLNKVVQLMGASTFEAVSVAATVIGLSVLTTL